MNNWPAPLVTELGKNPSTLCRLLVLTTVAGSIIRFTDHDQDVTVDGDLYAADHTFEPSAIENSIGGAHQNFDLTVLFKSSQITYDDALRGVYSGAAVSIYVASWGNPAAGKGLYTSGRVGTVTLDKQRLAGTFTVLGGSGIMARSMTEVYTPTCRADFGDSRCTIDIEAHGADFSVSSVTDAMNFIQSGTQADGFFNLGSLKWLTGDNAGQVQEVAASLATGAVALFYPPHYPMTVGDTGRIYQGCAKTLAACIGYNNLVNFRGEPYVPGDDYKAIT